MEELLNIPVTLVVKAPNQKIADQTVECALNWTVRKLKEHLASVYPSKPKENHQRIIYSGRLLQDDVTLKEVLRQYEPNQTIHTVHLVCAPTTEVGQQTSATAPPLASSTAGGSTTAGLSSTEGLRHRRPAANEQQPTSEAASTPGPGPEMAQPQVQSPQPGAYGSQPGAYGPQPAVAAAPQYSFPSAAYYATQPILSPYAVAGFGPAFQTGAFNPMMAAGAGMDLAGGMAGAGPYSLDQMMWMQQAYAQYLTQYMQYYQQTAQPVTPQLATDVQTQPPANQNAAPVAVPPLANAARPAAAANQPQAVRMNAQGGPMADDDEDEPNRDWLDWVYTAIRFAMLLCILYFYSTLSRFIMTLSLVALMYLYQGGWFRAQNRRARVLPAQQQQPQQQQPQQQQPVQQAQQQQEPAQQEAGDGGSNSADPSAATEVPPTVVEPMRPGTLTVAWNFFVAFFASLAPQPPPAVNAN